MKNQLDLIVLKVKMLCNRLHRDICNVPISRDNPEMLEYVRTPFMSTIMYKSLLVKY